MFAPCQGGYALYQLCIPFDSILLAEPREDIKTQTLSALDVGQKLYARTVFIFCES